VLGVEVINLYCVLTSRGRSYYHSLCTNVWGRGY